MNCDGQILRLEKKKKAYYLSKEKWSLYTKKKFIDTYKREFPNEKVFVNLFYKTNSMFIISIKFHSKEYEIRQEYNFFDFTSTYKNIYKEKNKHLNKTIVKQCNEDIPLELMFD